jgi:hypothetical protein
MASGSEALTMRIYAPNGTAAVAAAQAARRTAPSGFAVSEEEAPRSAGAASTLQTVGGAQACG